MSSFHNIRDAMRVDGSLKNPTARGHRDLLRLRTTASSGTGELLLPLILIAILVLMFIGSMPP